VGYSSVVDTMGLILSSSFVLPLLLPQPAVSCKILRKFGILGVQGHPKSLTLVPVKSTCAT